MKTRAAVSVILGGLFSLALPFQSVAGLSDFLKGSGMTFGSGTLSESKIARGLKEALETGAGNAVSLVSRSNGYYANPEIRIPLPAALQKVERLVRAAGHGESLDSFRRSMNRAAEKAAPHAKPLLWEAVRSMTLDDARGILNGADDAATAYLKEKTFDRLTGLFRPEVHDAMAMVDVTRRYQEVTELVSSIPFAGALGDFDLDGYVTERALDGLFFMLAKEERNIRQNPAARITDLQREVFGSRAAGE
jgi:hypothetical protein